MSRSDRRGKDFSTPLAGLDSNRYETGPISTGTVFTPSCAKRKIKINQSSVLSLNSMIENIPKVHTNSEFNKTIYSCNKHIGNNEPTPASEQTERRKTEKNMYMYILSFSPHHPICITDHKVSAVRLPLKVKPTMDTTLIMLLFK